jgi:tRNA threonylcarbamoyladenosine modification (KEOPS) complex  Pcc1 subunit
MPEPHRTASSAELGSTAAWEGDRTRGAVDFEASGSFAHLEITARDLRRAQGRLDSLLRLHAESRATRA